MYHQFYNLRLMPFENTPDPRFFYDSDQHREALAAIEYTIRMRKGFVLITGQIGSGKTTVGRTMCQRCSDIATIVNVTYGHEDRDSLLRQVLGELRLPLRRSDDHAKLVRRLQNHLLQQLEQDHPVVLLVDEAQTLSDAALEELRLMSNLDTTTDKLVQVVLVGQTDLMDRVMSERHGALRQRIVMSKQLKPFSLEDTGRYIEHRLRASSIDADDIQVRFEPQAIKRIYKFSGGVPRLINVTCDNCLLLGFVCEQASISGQIVERVLADMVPNFPDAAAQQHRTEQAQSLVGSW